MIKLINDDCIKAMSELPDNSVDAIIVDPPYQVTQCSWDTIIPLNLMWEQINRVCKDNAAVIIFSQQPFTSLLITSNISNYKYSITWKKNKKTNFLNAKKQPLRQTEEICVFYKKQCTYNPVMSEGHKPVNSFTKHTGDGDTLGKTKTGFKGGGQTNRHPTNIVEFNVVNNDGSKGKRHHSSQKPVDLLEYLVRTYTNENNVVLDFAMGSGTTGVACKNLNRRFIGIDDKKKYFDIAKDRINEIHDNR